MKTNIISIIGLCVAGLVGISEVLYYLSHPYRPGVSPHLIGICVALILVTIGSFRAK
jgi:hypothetical protein